MNETEQNIPNCFMSALRSKKVKYWNKEETEQVNQPA